MTWLKPPGVLYTHTQRAAKFEEGKADRLARTTDRTAESVLEAVKLLNQFLRSPERKDLAVTLLWLHGSPATDRPDLDKVNHLISEERHLTLLAKGMEGSLKQHWIHGNVLVLTGKQLLESCENEWWATQKFPPGIEGVTSRWAARTIPEEELSAIVCKYQLMPSQIRFLMTALKAGHRG